MADGRFVSWDRWDAEHRALTERVNLLARESGGTSQQGVAGSSADSRRSGSSADSSRDSGVAESRRKLKLLQIAVTFLVLLCIAWILVIGLAVVHIYHEQKKTDLHLCQTNRLLYAELQEIRVALNRPPLPPIPPCHVS
jgi:hypothetical protein